MFSMTDKQKAALFAIRNGAGPMPIIHFGVLRDAGYVEKADASAGKASRGYSMAKITDAGFRALEG